MTQPEAFPGAAVVTGGGSGIGRATAHAIAATGAQVAVVDIEPDSSDATAAGIQREGFAAIGVAADVATEDGARQAIDAATSEFGSVAVLVNNAGIGAQGTIEETDAATWHRVLEVNLGSVYHCSRAALPGMRGQLSGSIINVASAAALVGLPERAAYSASKAAIVGLTRAMAIDYANQGIRVNCVCPGTVDTPWIRRFAAESPDPEAFYSQMAARQPLGRLATAAEISASIVFLASDSASFITGSSLIVDGGLTAG